MEKGAEINLSFLAEYVKSYTASTVSYCYQCGTCSSSCPVAEEMDIKPHAMVEMLKLGLEAPLVKSKAIWQCTTCYNCTERCPQGVQLTTAIIGLRERALSAEHVLPDAVREVCKNLRDTGRLIGLSRFQQESRAKLNLPAVPPVDTEPVRKMVTKTNASRIVGVK